MLNISQKYWEVIINEDIYKMEIKNFPNKICKCLKPAIIKFSIKHERFYQGCIFYTGSDPNADHFSYLPKGLNYLKKPLLNLFLAVDDFLRGIFEEELKPKLIELTKVNPKKRKLEDN